MIDRADMHVRLLPLGAAWVGLGHPTQSNAFRPVRPRGGPPGPRVSGACWPSEPARLLPGHRFMTALRVQYANDHTLLQLLGPISSSVESRAWRATEPKRREVRGMLWVGLMGSGLCTATIAGHE
jgi:hypothetical protein